MMIRGQSSYSDTTRRIINMDCVQMIEAINNDVHLVAYINTGKDPKAPMQKINLGQYLGRSNGGARAELDKIQREYCKFLQSKTAFFDPPKIYVVGSAAAPNCHDVSYTNFDWSSIHENSGLVYVKCGLGIKCTDDWSIPLTAGSDYDISYPAFQGEGSHYYRLVFHLKGNYSGTYYVGFHWNPSN